MSLQYRFLAIIYICCDRRRRNIDGNERPASTCVGHVRTHRAVRVDSRPDPRVDVTLRRWHIVKDVHTLLSFDKDGSGTLDTEELRPALKQLGLEPSDRNLEKIARAWDADGSGKLDLLEFTDLVRTLQTFKKYDKDESGHLSLREFHVSRRRDLWRREITAPTSLL